MTYKIWNGRSIKQAIIIAMLFFISVFCHANSTSKVTILVSSENSAYQIVVNTIRKHLKSNIEIEEFSLGSIDSISTPPQLLLTVGSAALKSALVKFPDPPLIASFLPRRVFEELLTSTPRTQKNTTAIFIDQSMLRQLTLARLITPNGTTIGTVFGTSSISEKQRLYQAAKQTNFSVKSVLLNNDDNPVNILQPIIKKTDIFLALPDQAAFNRASAKWSLFIALKSKTPLLGFSEKYVDAGALAAVYSSPEQIGKHTAETLDNFLTTGELPHSAHPKYFTVKTNQKSARTIQIELPINDALQHQLEMVN